MNREPLTVSYPASGRPLDGVFTTLLMRLEGEVDFDQTALRAPPAGKKLVLLFRRGAKKLFHVTVIRRGARYFVEFSGGDPGKVLKAVQICKSHFDAWFNVSAGEIRESERVGEARPSPAMRDLRRAQDDLYLAMSSGERIDLALELTELCNELGALGRAGAR